MKFGRVRSQGATHSVVFTGKGLYKLSSIFEKSEQEISSDFYDIIVNSASEIQSSVSARGPDITSEWNFEIPIPSIGQIRDFYAFEEHVKAGRKNRGLEMIPEWYEIPVFYYSGTANLYASGQDVKYPSYSEALDYELELAVVIGAEGRNIHASRAKEHIAGAMLVNDWSARDEQMKEMKLNLGPAKGKDFGTSFGPYIVTKDELPGMMEKGRIDIEVRGYVNGEMYSRANTGSMYHSFYTMIERASRDVTLHSGDIIMSGTVGTGCILELGPEKHGWLKKGDLVELESDILGKLINRVV